jgi:hypothetical protein
MPRVSESAGQDSDLKTLELALDDLRRENVRLRDARSAVTSQLGPLPISAAVIAGLVTAFPGGHPGHAQRHLTVIALAVFGVMALVSAAAGKLKPYRTLRDEHEHHQGEASPTRITERAATRVLGGPAPAASRRPSTPEWYAAMVDVERAVTAGLKQRFGWEWWALFAVRASFAAVIALLVAARLS